MKKIISLFALAMMVSAGVAFAYQDDGNPNTKESSGASAADPVRVYRLVRYAEIAPNHTSLSAGDVVVWDCVSDDGVTVGLVAATNSADAVAGVVVSTTIPTADSTGTAQATVGHRNWGYIQTRGFCSNINTIGNLTAGVAIKASDTARNADTAVSGGLNGALKGRAMGFAYDTGVDGEAQIDL